MSTYSFMELELRSACSGRHYSLLPACDLPRLWAMMGLQRPKPPPRGFLISLEKDASSVPAQSSIPLTEYTTLESLPGMVLRGDCSEHHYSLLNADVLEMWEALGMARPDPLPRGFVAAKLRPH